MEGLGSRLGRASSRYGQTTTVFNGPVRRWKKRWVHVSSSSPSLTYQNPHSQSNNNGNSSRLILCRWTPISPANSPAEPAAAPDEPPCRKFRYTPELDESQSGLQDSNRSHLDLDLGLKGHSSNLDLMVQMKKGSSERFWLD